MTIVTLIYTVSFQMAAGNETAPTLLKFPRGFQCGYVKFEQRSSSRSG
jgi:hypothetical protein